MRILLTNPPSQNALNHVVGIRSPPVGLAYLASVAEAAGHEVSIIDSLTMGLSNEEVVRQAIEADPDVLGVGVTAIGYDDAMRIVSGVKARLPPVHAVVGGPLVSFTDQQTLAGCRAVDSVVRGEGEETFQQLLEAVDCGAEPAGIRGLTYRRNGEVLRNEDRPFIKDLDTLPLPAFHLLPMERYFLEEGHRYGCMITSRGCPHRCIFCASSNLFGKRWRFRSPENVVAEMAYLRGRFGVEHVEILDDTFAVSARRAEAICDLLIDQAPGLQWTASARTGSLTQRLADKMKAAGCCSVFLGFESASQEVLDSLGKGLRVEDAWETVAILRRAGILVIGAFIIGCPQDTDQTIRETIRFARALSPNYAQFTLLTPFPGTPLYDQAKARGWLRDRRWSDFSMVDPVLKHPGIPDHKLKRYIDWAYLSFYLRPRFLRQELARGSLFFVRRALKALCWYVHPSA